MDKNINILKYSTALKWYLSKNKSFILKFLTVIPLQKIIGHLNYSIKL